MADLQVLGSPELLQPKIESKPQTPNSTRKSSSILFSNNSNSNPISKDSANKEKVKETPQSDSPSVDNHRNNNNNNNNNGESTKVKVGESSKSGREENTGEKVDYHYNNNDDNDGKLHHSESGSSQVKTVPEVIYAKAGIILSPTSVIMDRSSNNGDVNGNGGVEGNRNGGGGSGDITHIMPGETLYIPPNVNQVHTNSKVNLPNGHYQVHPGYASSNGQLPHPPHNYNNNNNNNNNGHGAYYNNNGQNLGLQPNPYGNSNGNGHPPQPPHYTFIHYPGPPQQGMGGGGQGGGGVYPHPHQNYYDPMMNTNTTTEGINVRGEEVGIVLVVLLLWVGAIILFFNRWGKIRMLEPYQPKFCENHRPSCPMAEVTAITNHPCRERTFSKFNLSTEMLAGPNGSPHFVKCNYHGIPSADPAPGFSGLTTATATIVPGGVGGLIIPGSGFSPIGGGGSTGMLNNHRNSIMIMNHHHLYQHNQHQHPCSRPRQNSVFVTSPVSQVSFYGSDTTLQKSSSRKTKSAVDLPTLVLTGEFVDNSRRNSKHSITQL